MKTRLCRLLTVASMLCWIPSLATSGQTPAHLHEEAGAPPGSVPLQPFAQQVRRLEDTLNFVGQPLPAKAHEAINQAIASVEEGAAVTALQNAMDPFVLITVDINAESRVKVERGPATPNLVQGGSRFFLVKVLNHAGVTAPLVATSPNSGRVFIRSTNDPAPKMSLTNADVRDRWTNISIFNTPPATKTLSGLAVEYQVLEVFSRDAGQRSAEIGFNVGQGTQDIGFRNDLQIVFRADPARHIKLHLLDEKGQPTIMSLTIRDRWNRLYPSPSKRLAPDLFFQPQIYRQDGEYIDLPSGYYTITTTGGPEYRAHAKEFAVDANGPNEISFQLDRWIDPSQYRCYSGDHHVHAAGCSHYQNPAEGVLPKDMMRQIQGEKLNFGAVLTWGPDYYYQKQFFTGKDNPLSSTSEKMHYDLEVSGFPSSHAGHIVLLGLKDQDYPKTKRIEDWPTWDLPVLQWAKSQGALTGFAHSGWGLQVTDRTVPSFQMPGFDGIGANEYVVDVTYPNTIDFVSAGDTPYVWELSAWYHTLNVGFRTRLSGETDFPCITDERVGSGRSYVKLSDSAISYKAWLSGLKEGASYVSDGRAHLIDFSLNGTEIGTGGSQIDLASADSVHASVRVAALLDINPHPELQSLPYDQKPYWTIERARIGTTREVPVELIVNGKVVASKPVLADGNLHEVSFDAVISQSSWVAARILPAAHTNPMFVLVNKQPVRASRESAEWLVNAVHQCWTQKSPKISAAEQAAARAAYDHAETVYKKLEAECTR